MISIRSSAGSAPKPSTLELVVVMTERVDLMLVAVKRTSDRREGVSVDTYQGAFFQLYLQARTADPPSRSG